MNALTYNFLVSKFREYYIESSLEAPPGLLSREWGFLFFDDSGMRRHKSFFSRGELVDYVRAMVPRHVYHSAAYYQRPGAPTMKEKIWQGADLIFDLDADHLRNAPKSYSEMLELVKKETLKLLGFLTADFGFSENVIHVAFSGGRGYHIHIRDPRIFTLGGDERREIVDYLTGRGLDLESFIAKHKIIGGHGIEVVSALRCPPENAPGWGGRLNHAFISFQEELCEMPEDQALKMLCSTKGMKYNKANEFYTYIKTFDQILHGDIDEETAIQKLSSIKWIKDAEDFYLRLRLSYMVRKGEFDKIKSLKYSREFDIHKYKRICEDLSTGTINEPEAIKRLSSVGIFPIKTIAEQIREGNLDGFKGISGNWNILEKYLGEEGISIGSESYFDRERGETDEPVTADVRRLIRCPGSLHGGSGLRVTPLSIRDLEDFDPLQDAVVFGDESIPLEILKPFDTQMLGQSYHLVEGPTELPACVAVFLMARGVAEARTKL